MYYILKIVFIVLSSIMDILLENYSIRYSEFKSMNIKIVFISCVFFKII